MAIKKYLDLTGLQTYDQKIKALIESADDATLTAAKAYSDSLSDNYDPAGQAATLVQELEEGQVATNTASINTLNGKVGDLSGLDTTAKDTLVNAINEVAGAIGAAETAGEVTVDTSTTTANMAKSYTIKQGGATVATIDIPTSYNNATIDSKITQAVANAAHLKRSIVASLPEVGSADENTIYMVSKADGSGEQKYDEYMLINGAFEKIGDSAVDLTDYATKTEVTNAKNEAISTAATDATNKANQALANAKTYADGLASNYATAAQGAKADSALQASDVVTGTANGTIRVKGTDVQVKGLGSAAYKAVGSATGNVPVVGGTLSTTANTPVVVNASGQLVSHASGALGTAAFANTTDFDQNGVAQSLVTALQNGAVATNASNITALDGRLDTLETSFGNMDTYTAITTTEIEALFA